MRDGVLAGPAAGEGEAFRTAGWWCDIALLAGFAAVVYFSRLTTLPLRGEESRRARVAFEMVHCGDWVVPTQQGNPFFMSSRPPLQNWTIAAIGHLRGAIDVVAVRVPSATALLLTMLLVYAYSRLFLTRIGAVAAALAYGSMGQVMQLCRLGETDSMFALLVSGSLLGWHYGQVRGWPAWRTWMLAYLFVALGTLTKGMQAPAYFAAGVGSFLLVTGQWRRAISWSHAAGIGLFLAIWGAWQVPFFARLGWAGVVHVYTGDVVLYFKDRSWLTVVNHLATFPLEILFGCLMPWSLLLVLYLRRDFRGALGGAREHAVFLACAILAAFPTVWLAPTAKTRFFVSLYPAFAPLVGLVVDRCCHAEHNGPWRRFWGFYLTAAAMLMVAGGVAMVAVSLLRPSLPFAEPVGVAALLAGACAGLAGLAFWAGNSATPARRAAGTWAIALFLGLLHTGVVVSAQARLSNTTTGPAVAALKQKLQGARLVSLGSVDHLFTYYYLDPIEAVAWPERAEEIPPRAEYFCFSCTEQEPRWPEFAFETVEVICCDREANGAGRLVIVGKRPVSAAELAGRSGGTRPQ